MSQNLDNALHGVQEARTAIMVETGDAETLEQEDALEAIQVSQYALMSKGEFRVNP